MSQFDILLPYILRHEGVSVTNPTGYANIENDPGGETKWGISQREWSLLRVKPQFSNFPAAVKDLTFNNAFDIYHSVYYLPVFDELPPGPALVAFDAEVNEGVAIQLLQRAIGTIDDGKWGPASEQQLRLALRDAPVLVENLLWQRLAHYDSISKGSVVNQKFLATLWVPRLLQTRDEARRL